MDHLDPLGRANQAFAARYPGERTGRQPVHTVYGGGHLFRRDTAPRMGELALRSLEEYGGSAMAFAGAVGMPEALGERVFRLVQQKLVTEPVEDYRIDFEDGYGSRPDAEEDAHAAAAAREVAAGLDGAILPPCVGIRVKPLTQELRRRSVRTMELFLTEVVQAAGRLPSNLVVTLPKVTVPEQVAYAIETIASLESRLGLEAGSVALELMVEMPQNIIDHEGRCPLPALIAAGAGRIRGAHFGTYDYTAGLGITAQFQRMNHPACDFARNVMQVVLAGSGVWLSDGATAILPVPVHRSAAGRVLSPHQLEENRHTVHRAWALHYADVRHSLETGYYQGWDLHPAQLPTRYAAVFGFFLEGQDAAGERLRNFLSQAAQATLAGDVFDDAATGQGLLNYFLRAINSGAISEADAARVTGLAADDLRSRSFARILERRNR